MATWEEFTNEEEIIKDLWFVAKINFSTITKWVHGKLCFGF